jgi:hypothetical protein
MEYIFTPSQCKGDDKIFEGTVILKVLSTTQKFRLMSKCEFELTEDGLNKKSMKQLNIIADLIDATKPYFLKVEIKNISTGKEYKTFDDLEYNDECSTLLIECATQFMNGFKLGNG